MKQILIIILTLVLALNLVNAFEIQLDSEIVVNDDLTASSWFRAGTSDNSNDDLDSYDARMIGGMGYNIPIFSEVNGEYFMIDYKQTLTSEETKTWQLTQQGSREFRNTGVFDETITWTLTDVPDDITITLVDYDQDSTRTTPIKEINLKQESNYAFEVIQPYGNYRFFDLVVVKAAEEQNTPPDEPNNDDSSNDNSDNSNDDSSSSSNDDSDNESNDDSCTPDWTCDEWTTCSEDGTKTRACVDINECNDISNKPDETRICFDTPAIEDEPEIVVETTSKDTRTEEEKWTKVESEETSENSITGAAVADNGYSTDFSLSELFDDIKSFFSNIFSKIKALFD